VYTGGHPQHQAGQGVEDKRQERFSAKARAFQRREQERFSADFEKSKSVSAQGVVKDESLSHQ